MIGDDNWQKYKQLMSSQMDPRCPHVPQTMATLKHRISCHIKGALANLRRDMASTRGIPTRQPPAARDSLNNTHSIPAEETFAPPPIPVRRSATEITGACTVSSLHVNRDFEPNFAFIVIYITTMYVPACNYQILIRFPDYIISPNASTLSLELQYLVNFRRDLGWEDN